MFKLASVLLATIALSACTNIEKRVLQASPETVPLQTAEASSTVSQPLDDIAFESTVQAWIDAAVQRSATVAIAQSRLQAARALNRSALGSLLPELTANLGANDISQRSVQTPATDEADLPVRSQRRQGSLEFRWELDLFGAGRKRLSAASSEMQASQADVLAAQQAVAAELQQTLVRHYAATERLAINAQLLGVLSRIETLEKALADSGIRSKSEWLRVRAEALARRSVAENDALELEAQTLRLRALSDSPREQTLALLQNTSAPKTCALANDFALPLASLSARPDVNAALWRLRAALNEADAAQLDRLPSISLTGSSGTNRQENSDIFTALTKSFEHGFGVSILQKIFAGGRIQASADSATAKAGEQAAAYRQTLLLAAEETDFAIASAKQSSTGAMRLNDALADSDNLQKMAQARFNAGIDSRLDASTAEREYLERSLAAIEGNRDVCIAAINVRRALSQVWHLNSNTRTKSKTINPAQLTQQ